MPDYSALFDGAATRPTQAARDLVAYLETLGRARALAGPEGEQQAKTAPMDAHMAQLAFASPVLNAHPAAVRSGEAPPLLEGVQPASNARQLWQNNCAGCHGPQGRGDGPAAAWLRPLPANLVEHRYTGEYVLTALWNGVAGTSMPAWRDQPPANLLALAELVQGFSTAGNPPAADAATLALGAGVYATHCIQCHGSEGRGDGFAAGEFSVAAVDFTRQQPSLAQGLQVLQNGIAGSPMARWADRLDATEQQAVVHYVRAFFQADTSSEVPDDAD
jgi:mono/diheme cytochrome c family protein